MKSQVFAWLFYVGRKIQIFLKCIFRQRVSKGVFFIVKIFHIEAFFINMVIYIYNWVTDYGLKFQAWT
jgi:hypothetical protein